MTGFLRRETARVRDAARRMTRREWMAAAVLTAAAVLVLVQMQLGARSVYEHRLGNPFGFRDPAFGGWAWWFSMQGVTGFVVPVLLLRFGFRQRLAQMGLGPGDWKLALALALAYAPLVVVGTWVLSAGQDFQLQYPHYLPAQFDWGLFAAYQALFLFYWIGWEYLWRGFVLFGTAPAVGAPLAIVIQTVPFAILHALKPAAEAYLSVLGGLALGALVWRCRSFWIAVPIHAFQMFALDLWCSLRARTGAAGTGLDALRQALGGF
ncbi:MAG: lysostaphin resistance A-like protein [Rubricoccaceae bacterium]